MPALLLRVLPQGNPYLRRIYKAEPNDVRYWLERVVSSVEKTEYTVYTEFKTAQITALFSGLETSYYISPVDVKMTANGQ